MARVSRVGLGWAVEDRINWYADTLSWYDAEKSIDYGSLIEAVCKGDCTPAVNNDLTGDAINGAWIYADASVYYDFTNENSIPFIAQRTQLNGLDIRVSGIFLKTNGVSGSFEPVNTFNKRSLVEDCRIKEVNPSSTAYGVQINGAGSQANQDVFLRCVIDRADVSNSAELVKQAVANGYGAIRNCVLISGAGKYADGSNNVGLEVTDCVGLGSAGYDATSLILNTSSSEDSSGTSGLRLIGSNALSNVGAGDFRTKSGGDLDVAGTNTPYIGVGLDVAASDSITLTPFSSTGRYVFNRELTGADRSITVNVSLSGDPSGGIEWRLVNNAGGDPIPGYDWSTFLSSPSSGSHAVSVNVPTSTGRLWYKLELRFALDSSITAASVNEFAVGAIVVDNGQSNCQYRDTLTSSPPIISPDASYCTASGWQPSFSNGNGAIAKANALISLLDVPVGYYNNGLISQALPYFVTGTGWVNLSSVMNNYLDNYFEIMSFDQGETDARTGVTTATYQTNCQTLLDNILAQMSRPATQFNFAMCLGGNSNGYNPGNYTDSSLEQIRDAKRNFTAANAGVTLGHRIDFPLSDTIHHSPETYELIAAREVLEYSSHLGLSPVNSREITSAQVVGGQLTLTYSSGDVLTKIGNGGATITQVSDDGFSTLIPIIATTVDGNSVVHTLSMTPTGEVDVREYYGINIDVSTRADLIFPSSATSSASSTLNLNVTGIPDGDYMTVLDLSDGTRLTRQNETYVNGSLSKILGVDVGTIVKGYVDDGLDPSSNGAYLEGITE